MNHARCHVALSLGIFSGVSIGASVGHLPNPAAFGFVIVGLISGFAAHVVLAGAR